MDWIDLAQYRDRWRALVNVVTNLPVSSNARNFLTSFAGRTLLHRVRNYVLFYRELADRNSFYSLCILLD
jgi:hypothetical protein